MQPMGGGRQAVVRCGGQSGGSPDVAGPALVGGMMYIVSGYAGALGVAPNNLLLVFSTDGK